MSHLNSMQFFRSKFIIIKNCTVFLFSLLIANLSFSNDSFSSNSLSNTPHIDFVENKLHQIAPLANGSVWQRTSGNKIAGYGQQEDSWLLQTPNCWGDASCANTGALERLANTIEQDISAAKYWVDITTLVTYPDGIFQRAIVAGIKSAYAKYPSVHFRILGGTPPALGNFNTAYSETAHHYLTRLKADLGPEADRMKISVAGVETSWLYSWNHSKIVAVDGNTSIVGGHNMWEAAYGQVANPVSDLTMRLEGPASRASQDFADLLWEFTCKWQSGAINTTFYVDYYATAAVSSCPSEYIIPDFAATGNVEVLALGGLGFGMENPDEGAPGIANANDKYADCSFFFTDYINQNKDYSNANPEEEGLRLFIESARQSVFISQQDLIAACVPPFANSYYDARLFDVLAKQLTNNVKIQIVVSSPGATQGAAAPYSNMKKMTEISDILLRKLAKNEGLSTTQAKQMVCQNLQLAPLNIASGVTAWENGNTIANHSKTIAVDGAAFYIGSKNLYPASLQDFGYIVENAKAAGEYYQYYQQPMWNNSKGSAVVDFERGVCAI